MGAAYEWNITRKRKITDMKVLVTGACGNAGQAVCRVLAANGIEIWMADRTPPAREDAAYSLSFSFARGESKEVFLSSLRKRC
jgi:nucleoside-diphosphate-sugar epimerase